MHVPLETGLGGQHSAWLPNRTVPTVPIVSWWPWPECPDLALSHRVWAMLLTGVFYQSPPLNSLRLGGRVWSLRLSQHTGTHVHMDACTHTPTVHTQHTHADTVHMQTYSIHTRRPAMHIHTHNAYRPTVHTHACRPTVRTHAGTQCTHTCGHSGCTCTQTPVCTHCYLHTVALHQSRTEFLWHTGCPQLGPLCPPVPPL